MRCLQTQTGISAAPKPRRNRRLILGLIGSAVISAAAFSLDASAQQWVAEHKTSSGVSFMRAVSQWGDWYSHAAVGAILGALAYARGRRRWFRIFVAMLLACAIAGIVTRVLKVTTGRARPSVRVEAGWNGPRFDSKYNAFPSGHTASSTAFFAALAFASTRLGLLFLPIPLLIACSRMYVGAHHLSDVVCAALLGVWVAWFVARSKLLSGGSPHLVADPIQPGVVP